MDYFIIAVIVVISVFAEHLFKQKKNKKTRMTRETVNKGQTAKIDTLDLMFDTLINNRMSTPEE